MMSVASTGEYTDRGDADPADGFVLPFIELAMAFEVVDDGEKTWAACLREAAHLSDGELLFVLPAAGDANNEGANAVLRIRQGGRELLAFAYRDGVDTVFLEEAEADGIVAAFARTLVDVLERMKDDERIVAPLAATSH